MNNAGIRLDIIRSKFTPLFALGSTSRRPDFSIAHKIVKKFSSTICPFVPVRDRTKFNVEAFVRGLDDCPVGHRHGALHYLVNSATVHVHSPCSTPLTGLTPSEGTKAGDLSSKIVRPRRTAISRLPPLLRELEPACKIMRTPSFVYATIRHYFSSVEPTSRGREAGKSTIAPKGSRLLLRLTFELGPHARSPDGTHVL